MSPKASVVVPVFNGLPSLKDQAQCLLRQKFYEPFEILYVDNGSNDGSQEYICQLRPRAGVQVRLIDGSASRGQVYARNVGSIQARSDLLAYHDQDDLTADTWLSELVRAMLDCEAVGGFVHVMSPGFEIDPSPRKPAEDLHFLLKRFRTALGTNFAIRRDALAAVGGWRDLGLFAGEDIDMCARLEANGCKIRYAPKARVTWRARNESRGIFKQFMAYGRADVRLFLLWEHAGARLQTKLEVLKQWKAGIVGMIQHPASRPNRLKQLQRVAWSWGQLFERREFGVYGTTVPRTRKVQTYIESVEQNLQQGYALFRNRLAPNVLGDSIREQRVITTLRFR